MEPAVPTLAPFFIEEGVQTYEESLAKTHPENKVADIQVTLFSDRIVVATKLAAPRDALREL
eukprot:6392131-Prorocentrum_lima.AAC.1